MIAQSSRRLESGRDSYQDESVRLTVLTGMPDEVLVLDEPEPCPYRVGQTARMPLRLPIRALTPSETDYHFARGDRRHGRLLYRPDCPTCSACEAIRIDFETFRPSRTQRRTKRRGDRLIRTVIGSPRVDRERLALYEKHKLGRGLVVGSGKPLDEKGYFGFLVDRCLESVELSYYLGDQLVGIAVTDRGEESLSAVYCFYDPDYPELSIGTYSILTQVARGRDWGYRYLYLGLYIADNEHMNYKGRFLPHERLTTGGWRTFDRPR